MKKHFFSALVLMTGAFILSFSGCYFSGNPYEVATREESGTALSQTESKSQARLMYEEARKDGYEKSYVEFLQEIGVSAEDSLSVNSALLSTVEVYASFSLSQLGGSASMYYSVGAGVFLDVDRAEGDALIVTNYHVVYNANSAGRETIPHISDQITLYLYGARTEERGISAEYVGGVMESDIAVLRVENSEQLKTSAARAADFADSDEVCVGDRVYAVGNPNSKGISAVSGILSVDAEYINITAADERTNVSMLVMRTDAPVNHGNSGGGLFNAAGELIGVVNARSEESGVEHLGYAIPSNLVYAIAWNIVDNDKADNSHGAMRATLGITVQTADMWSEYDETAGRVRVKETVKIEQVGSGPSAGKLRAGDVLRSVRIAGGEEKEITRRHILNTELYKVRKGDTIVLTVLRGGQSVETEIAFTSDDDFTPLK